MQRSLKVVQQHCRKVCQRVTNWVIKVSAIEVHLPIQKIILALEAISVKINVNHQEVHENVSSIKNNNNRGLQGKILRLVNEEPTIMSSRIVKLPWDLKPLKVMQEREEVSFINLISFLYIERLTFEAQLNFALKIRHEVTRGYRIDTYSEEVRYWSLFSVVSAGKASFYINLKKESIDKRFIKVSLEKRAFESSRE